MINYYTIILTITTTFIITIIVLNYLSIYKNEYFNSKNNDIYNDTKYIKNMLQNNQFRYIIDVRTIPEVKQGYYPNSINIPIQEFNINKLYQIIPNIKKKDNILIYCRSGRRSKIAYQILKNNNFDNVYYLNGSYQLLLDS